MAHDEECCLHSELGSAWGDSGEGGTRYQSIRVPRSNLATVRDLEKVSVPTAGKLGVSQPTFATT